MIERVNPKTTRISHGFDRMSILRTSAGNIRIGGMPDSFRFLKRFKSSCRYVIIIPPELSLPGDNLAGEETLLLQEALKEKPVSPTYIGRSRDIGFLSERLAMADGIRIPGFDRVRKRNARSLFRSQSLNNNDDRIRVGNVEIVFTSKNLEIFDNHGLLYDHRDMLEGTNIQYRTEKLFEKIPPRTPPFRGLSVFVAGNGMNNIGPSMIVRYGERRIWMDVCARPFQILARNRIHPDSITDFAVTQGLEEACPGIPAILCRARDNLQIVNLLTTFPIYSILKKRYSPLCPAGFDSLVNFINLNPGLLLPYFKGGVLAVQESQEGSSLGLRFEYDGCLAAYGRSVNTGKPGVPQSGKAGFFPNWNKKCGMLFQNELPDNTKKSNFLSIKGLTVSFGKRLGIGHKPALEGFWYSVRKAKIKIAKKA